MQLAFYKMILSALTCRRAHIFLKLLGQTK